MIAQASAAQLNKYLFGDIFSGGSNSGAIGANFSDVFKFLGFMARVGVRAERRPGLSAQG